MFFLILKPICICIVLHTRSGVGNGPQGRAGGECSRAPGMWEGSVGGGRGQWEVGGVSGRWEGSVGGVSQAVGRYVHPPPWREAVMATHTPLQPNQPRPTDSSSSSGYTVCDTACRTQSLPSNVLRM
jgi:hypothetical protein